MTAGVRLVCLVVALAPAAAHAEKVVARVEKVDGRAAGLDPDKVAQVRAELQRFVDDKQIAGAVAIVGRRGRIGSLQVVGLRDVEARAPMRADTIFRLASMTKIVTAVAVMMLDQQGKLSVDDPVGKYLP